MTLRLEQRGRGTSLAIYVGPVLPQDARAALGPAPWIVSVDGAESLQQILGFARVNRADLWLAAVIAYGQKFQQLRLEALDGEPDALAWVSIDAMYADSPPSALDVQVARDLVAQARAGRITFVLAHSYLQPERHLELTSTVEMARLATGWALPMPPPGQTVVRSDGPPTEHDRDLADERSRRNPAPRSGLPDLRIGDFVFRPTVSLRTDDTRDTPQNLERARSREDDARAARYNGYGGHAPAFPLGPRADVPIAPLTGPRREQSGGLEVYSTGATSWDAYYDQAGRLLPFVLGRHVRGLVDLEARPDVERAQVDPDASPSPEPWPVQLDLSGP